MDVRAVPSFEAISAGLPTFDQIREGLPSFDEISEGLVFPTDEPQFDAATDSEVDTTIRLPNDLSYTRTPRRRLAVDYRANADAYKHLQHLPELGEDVEMLISGKYAMFELIAGLIERSGQTIDHLTITTLSFSKPNASDLLGLLDTGHIKQISLLISYYFKSTSREIYDSLVPELRTRGHKVLAMRNHTKVILAKLSDGRCFVFRGSANLRSSQNIENLTATQCPDLYAFHYGWIHDLINTKKDLGGA